MCCIRHRTAYPSVEGRRVDILGIRSRMRMVSQISVLAIQLSWSSDGMGHGYLAPVVLPAFSRPGGDRIQQETPIFLGRDLGVHCECVRVAVDRDDHSHDHRIVMARR